MARINLIIEQWTCARCDYVYDPVVGDPTSGVKPRTSFTHLPDFWTCPDCGATRENFVPRIDEGKKSFQ